MLNEMTKMCYDVSEAEVTRAKNQLKASMMFFQDSTHRECPEGMWEGRGEEGGEAVRWVALMCRRCHVASCHVISSAHQAA